MSDCGTFKEDERTRFRNVKGSLGRVADVIDHGAALANDHAHSGIVEQ